MKHVDNLNITAALVYNSKSPRSQNELYFRDLFFDDKFLFKCKIHHLSFNPINTHSASIRVISCSYPRNF